MRNRSDEIYSMIYKDSILLRGRGDTFVTLITALIHFVYMYRKFYIHVLAQINFRHFFSDHDMQILVGILGRRTGGQSCTAYSYIAVLRSRVTKN